jgi:hypothetical protein
MAEDVPECVEVGGLVGSLFENKKATGRSPFLRVAGRAKHRAFVRQIVDQS